MNQDQVKSLLLELEPSAPEFILLFTGKASRKVHGLYKPETREILLHNKNFTSQEELLYTAIHEFAHHLHFCSDQRPTSTRAHNTYYWNLFHRLLKKAEDRGLYRNVFVSEPEFVELTEEIKDKFLHTNGNLMKEFGKALLRAVELCKKYHVHFEDYMDRALCIPRITAKTVMRSYSENVSGDFGYDHLKLLTGIRDPEKREHLTQLASQGFSPDMIRQELKHPDSPPVDIRPTPISTVELLIRNRDVLKKRAQELQAQIEKIETQIREAQTKETL